VLHPVRLAEFSVNFSYSGDSSLGRVPACHAGSPGSIPGRCSLIFGIWREVLGLNVYITSQYFFPAIINRDIISHITITYRYIMYFFRTFKKSTAPYKVHNMGLRYIIILDVLAPSFPVILLERELLGAWAAIVQNTEVKG
jgi:hypothetical protein